MQNLTKKGFEIWLFLSAEFGIKILNSKMVIVFGMPDIWQFSLMIAASVTPKTNREIMLDTNLEKYFIENSVRFWVQ